MGKKHTVINLEQLAYKSADEPLTQAEMDAAFWYRLSMQNTSAAKALHEHLRNNPPEYTCEQLRPANCGYTDDELAEKEGEPDDPGPYIHDPSDEPVE